MRLRISLPSSVFGPNAVLTEDEPEYISREEFLASEITKLGYHSQTRRNCLNADPDDFVTDALSEGELKPELREQILWVIAIYQDVIDWPYQGEFAERLGYAGVLSRLRDEAFPAGERSGCPTRR